MAFDNVASVDLTSLSERLGLGSEFPLVELRADPNNAHALFVKDDGVGRARPIETSALVAEGLPTKYMIVAYEPLGSERSLYPVQRGSLRVAPALDTAGGVVLAVELTQFPLGAEPDDVDAIFDLVQWAAQQVGAQSVLVDLADQDLAGVVTERGFQPTPDQRWVRQVAP
jgi:hypothetical protein